MADNKNDLLELSMKLERYSPNEYFDYLPDNDAAPRANTTTETANENAVVDHINNNTVAENNNASVESSVALTSGENAAADSAGLLALLTEWDLACLYNPCVEQLIDVEMLKYITPSQCNLLAAEFPLGIKIRFVARVMQWRGY